MPQQSEDYNLIKTSFTGGELSTRMTGRVDFEKYGTGVSELENWQIQPQGGIERRNGSRFVAEVKDSSAVTMLYPFEFSTIQAYVLEIGNLYMRFYRNEGRIETAAGAVELTLPYTTAQLSAMGFAQSADTLYITHQSYSPRKVTRTSDTLWSKTTIAFTDGPYLDANTSSSSTLSVSSSTYALADAGLLVSVGQTPGPFQSGHAPSADNPGAIWQLKSGTKETWLQVVTVVTSTTATVTIMKAVDAALQATATSIWSEGAWSNYRGYPATVLIKDQRLMFANSVTEPQKIWASKTNDYENMTPQATIGTTVDTDPWSFKLGSAKVDAIRWLADSSRGLIVGTVGNEWVGSNATGQGPVTSNSVYFRSNTSYGVANTRPIRISNYVVFVQRSTKKLRAAEYNFLKDSLVADELTLVANHITGDDGIASGSGALAYNAEPDYTFHAIRNDGVMADLCYLPEEKINGWARNVTDGTYESVASILHSGGKFNITWAIVKRTINGATKRYVEWFDPEIHTDSGATITGINTTATLTITTASVTTSAEIISNTAGTWSSADIGKEIVALPSPISYLPDGVPVFDDPPVYYSDGGSGRALITATPTSTTATVTIFNAFASSSVAPSHWGKGVYTITGLSYLEAKELNLIDITFGGAVYPNVTVSGGSITVPTGQPSIVNGELGLPFEASVTTLRPEPNKGGETIQSDKKRWARLKIRGQAMRGITLNGTEIPSRNFVMPLGVAPDPLTGDIILTNATGWDYDAQVTLAQPNPVYTAIFAIFGKLETAAI